MPTTFKGVNTSAKKVILLDNCKVDQNYLLTSFEISYQKSRKLFRTAGEIYILTDNLRAKKKTR